MTCPHTAARAALDARTKRASETAERSLPTGFERTVVTAMRCQCGKLLERIVRCEGKERRVET